ncbi:hypothetical protein ACKAV7_004208 [Fusarium commune]
MLDGDDSAAVTADDALLVVDFSLYFEHLVVFLKELVVPLFEKRPLAPDGITITRIVSGETLTLINFSPDISGKRVH